MTRGQFGGSGYDPISPESNGMQGTDSRYTVREGDTLQGIAASLWGDSSLWYMIAEANGLSGAQSPAAGTSLRIPDKVTNIHDSTRRSTASPRASRKPDGVRRGLRGSPRRSQKCHSTVAKLKPGEPTPGA